MWNCEQRRMSGYATYQEVGSAHQVSSGFVVVSPDVERPHPIRATRNTILGAVCRFSRVRDCQSIFNLDFSERPWHVARHTSLACLGHHFANGYPAVPVAGTVASHRSASGALASVWVVSDGSRLLAESSRLPLDSLSCQNPHLP